MAESSLHQHSFFRKMELSKDEAAIFAGVCETVTIPANTVIFQENADGDAMYLTVSGRVNITTRITDKLEKVLYTVPPDSIFGEMALLDEGARSATAAAIDDVALIKIPVQAVTKITKEAPTLGMKFFHEINRVLVERLRVFNNVYRQNILWGLEVSGATRLGFSDLISGSIPVRFLLLGGKEVLGRIVKVDERTHGFEFTVRTELEETLIIPYRSVICIAIQHDNRFFEYALD